MYDLIFYHIRTSVCTQQLLVWSPDFILICERSEQVHMMRGVSWGQDPRTGEAVERDLWVTRKGATPAREGQLGLIPGSMGARAEYR